MWSLFLKHSFSNSKVLYGIQKFEDVKFTELVHSGREHLNVRNEQELKLKVKQPVVYKAVTHTKIILKWSSAKVKAATILH